MSLIPLAVSNLLAKTVAPRLLGKFGYRNIMVINTFTIGSLLAAFYFIGPGTREFTLLAMLALLGAANSIQFTCMNTLTLIDLPNADASSGNFPAFHDHAVVHCVSTAAASLLLDCFGGHAATSGPPWNRLSRHVRHHRNDCGGKFLHLRPGGQGQGQNPQKAENRMTVSGTFPSVQEQETSPPVSREQHWQTARATLPGQSGFLSGPRAT